MRLRPQTPHLAAGQLQRQQMVDLWRWTAPTPRLLLTSGGERPSQQLQPTQQLLLLMGLMDLKKATTVSCRSSMLALDQSLRCSHGHVQRQLLR